MTRQVDSDTRQWLPGGSHRGRRAGAGGGGWGEAPQHSSTHRLPSWPPAPLWASHLCASVQRPITGEFILKHSKNIVEGVGGYGVAWAGQTAGHRGGRQGPHNDGTQPCGVKDGVGDGGFESALLAVAGGVGTSSAPFARPVLQPTWPCPAASLRTHAAGCWAVPQRPGREGAWLHPGREEQPSAALRRPWLCLRSPPRGLGRVLRLTDRDGILRYIVSRKV